MQCSILRFHRLLAGSQWLCDAIIYGLQDCTRPVAPSPTLFGSEPMLNIFTLANGRLFQEEIESLEEL
ncbi:hypothetical protein, partial [Rhodoferax sp.]|uniref:hypothetical protein n=1 Tax=Rhodoferax sp. TaxID=50421 RepID=UPI0025D60CE4